MQICGSRGSGKYRPGPATVGAGFKLIAACSGNGGPCQSQRGSRSRCSDKRSRDRRGRRSTNQKRCERHRRVRASLLRDPRRKNGLLRRDHRHKASVGPFVRVKPDFCPKARVESSDFSLQPRREAARCRNGRGVVGRGCPRGCIDCRECRVAQVTCLARSPGRAREKLPLFKPFHRGLVAHEFRYRMPLRKHVSAAP